MKSLIGYDKKAYNVRDFVSVSVSAWMGAGLYSSVCASMRETATSTQQRLTSLNTA